MLKANQPSTQNKVSGKQVIFLLFEKPQQPVPKITHSGYYGKTDVNADDYRIGLHYINFLILCTIDSQKKSI